MQTFDDQSEKEQSILTRQVAKFCAVWNTQSMYKLQWPRFWSRGGL